MGEPVQTTVAERPGSRVRVDVEVAPAEVAARVRRKASQLGRELKLPGFRKGKVPAPLVLQRLGREAVLEDAVRDGLGGWYAEAIRDSGIVPVGDPKIDLGELPEPGRGLRFSFEIGVLPAAELGEYVGLEVARREAVVDEELIEREIEALRERLARLETAERPAAAGDYVVVDYVGQLRTVDQDSGETPSSSSSTSSSSSAASESAATTLVAFAGGEGRDQLVELGGGKLIPGFEEGLLGARAGETRTVELEFPADYPNAELAGREASFEIAVKEVKDKRLPDVDEDFAMDAGFDDIDDLREDIGRRLLQAEEQRVGEEFREAALDAAVAGARVDVTEELARARAREMWERMLHTLSHRGITREAYLRIVGRTEEEILAEMVPDAERGLRREAVLSAIVAVEEIEPSEQDLLQALAPAAEREGLAPERMLAQLREAGRAEELSEDLAARQAVELIVRGAKPIPLEQAAAREKLWTPEKEAEGERSGAVAVGSESDPAGGLWTPGR